MIYEKLVLETGMSIIQIYFYATFGALEGVERGENPPLFIHFIGGG